MEDLKCPHCDGVLGRGATVCGECGKEIVPEEQPPVREEKRSGKNIYAFLAVLLAVVGGLALLLFVGLIPNPLKGGSTAAIVNGEKITMEELDKKIDMVKKIYGQSGNVDFSSPEGKKLLAEISGHVLESMIQEKILVTEAVREKVAVSPQQIAERINAIKTGMNLSEKDFEEFLKNHSMSLSSFEKRVEKDALVANLIAKGAEKGLARDAWLRELNARAKVERFIK